MARPQNTPVAVPTHRSIRRRFTLLVAVLILAGVGYAASRYFIRSSERRDALALAQSAHAVDALPALLHSLDHYPDDEELLRATIRVMVREGKPSDEIVPFAERWSRLAPNDPDPLRAQVALLRQSKRQADAATAAERVLMLAPDDHETRAALAGLYLALGRFADAETEYRRLLDSSPLPPTNLRVGLARALSEQGNAAEAGKLLNRVLSDSPDLGNALILRGMVHYQSGEHEAAVATLRRVKPDSQSQREIVLYHLGLCLERLGKSEESKKAFAELAAIQTAGVYKSDAITRPDDLSLQLRAAEALLATDQASEARVILETALSHLGPNRTILLELAKCYDKLGQPAQAKDARARAERIP